MKIEPGVMCYLLYVDPNYVDESVLRYNGSAIVEITAFAGRGHPRSVWEGCNFWYFNIPGFGLAHAAEHILQPIPPNKLEQLHETNKPKEETPA